eukprot:3931843-Rhodomonas_salina.1
MSQVERECFADHQPPRPNGTPTRVSHRYPSSNPPQSHVKRPPRAPPLDRTSPRRNIVSQHLTSWAAARTVPPALPMSAAWGAPTSVGVQKSVWGRGVGQRGG